MPELPEVETIRRSLVSVEGARITRVQGRCVQLRQPLTTEDLRPALGQRIVGSSRRGKYLLLHLLDGAGLLFHFGMSGTLLVRAQAEPRREHDHLVLELEQGTSLVFHDPRRFGLVRFVANAEEPSEFAQLGPDAWCDPYDAEYLFAQSRHRRLAVKAWLMDQRVIAGLGNIYASEALFRAGIRPGRQARRLSRSECARLHWAIRTTLAEAITAGGSSISDFLDAQGRPGYFQHRFQVYERERQPCLHCGSPIRRRVLAGRSTYYCPRCQQ